MKEKFIKSTIILIIGGLATKILGTIIRVIMTRIIGVEGIGLYMLIMPTYGLFITIATFSLPIAISKLVSENNKNNRNVVLGIIPVAIIFNIILIIIIVLLASFIADDLLQNNNLYYPILAMAITLPFITLSNIIRGYFFGKERMTPHVISNLFEQAIRIILILFICPILLDIGIITAIMGIILFNVISELFSTIILVLFIPKNAKISKDDLIPKKDVVRDIFSVSFPTTMGRIINSMGNFLEPIIITFVLLKIGYTSKHITIEYGMIAGFVFPMVMLPQFLSGAISSALLPVVSKYNSLKMKNAIKRKFYQSILISLLIGLVFTTLFMIFPDQALKIMFGDSSSSKYLFAAAPIFLLTYIQGPIISTLQAMNMAKTIMISSLIGVIIKTAILFVMLFLDINMYALLIAILFQYAFVTCYQYFKIKKVF